MSYEIKYSDFLNKGSITVIDGTINVSTSLSFPGKFIPDYGTIIAENFLHLLENFANKDEPSNAVEGQLWYDNNEGVNQLKLYDGTQWVSASGLKKSLTQPSTSSSSQGDLWVNLDSQQLYLYTGAAWVLVGPEYSAGLFTGVKVESIVDTENKTYTIFTLKVLNKIIAIYSLNTFTPKTLVPGFTSINPGINLSSEYKIYGTSEKAENLVIGGSVVPAENFLRSDQVSTTSNQLRILSDQGIIVGANAQTSIKVDNNSTVIQNSVSGSTLDIKMKNVNNIAPTTVVKIKSTGEVGIGSNELDISDRLSVFGNIKIIPEEGNTVNTGRLFVENTNEATDIDTGSIVTDGGIGVAKSVYVGGNLTVTENLNTGNIYPSLPNKNIGSTTQKYNEVYATRFFGSLTGNVTGTVTGRAGSADKLTNARAFSVEGDVESNSVPFDGQNDVNLLIRIKNTLVSDRNETLTAGNLDEIIINKKDVTGDVGLFKITKQNFLKSIPIMPIGMIAPYAGQRVPPGWLLCDGSEVRKSEYLELFNIIGFSFKPAFDISDQGIQFFGLPDLRGRFPLGLTNMGGTDSERISNNTATTVGNVGGMESVVIEKRNLPEHEHDMLGEAGNQYYAVRAGADAPVDDNALVLSLDSGTGGTHGIPTTGGVLTDQLLNRPMNVLNPYLAVNYIIYTGK